MSSLGYADLRKTIMQEAVRRQGTVIDWDAPGYKLPLRVNGDPSRAYFDTGAEGLVHLVRDELTQRRWRLKCFWLPDEERRLRCEVLTRQMLANPAKPVADSLGGAPLSFYDNMGGETRFAVLMKDVGGSTWESWLERGRVAGPSGFPFSNWPPTRIRLIWAIGLAVAIDRMEQSEFIHADISPRNVMVTAEGKYKGDMALVDFDGFVCPALRVSDTHLKGSEGFAAPEVWDQRGLAKGSDRVGMAIMIEQFMIAGQPTVPFKEALFWEYTQEQLENRQARANPHFRRLYPDLADLLDETLAAVSPDQRPSPERWERLLTEHYTRLKPIDSAIAAKPQQILSDSAASQGSLVLKDVQLSRESAAHPDAIRFPTGATKLDLLTTSFRVRANLVRHADNTMTLEVHDEAQVRVKDNSGQWRIVSGGDSIPILSDLLLYDVQGASIVKLTGTLVPASNE